MTYIVTCCVFISMGFTYYAKFPIWLNQPATDFPVATVLETQPWSMDKDSFPTSKYIMYYKIYIERLYIRSYVSILVLGTVWIWLGKQAWYDPLLLYTFRSDKVMLCMIPLDLHTAIAMKLDDLKASANSSVVSSDSPLLSWTQCRVEWQLLG